MEKILIKLIGFKQPNEVEFRPESSQRLSPIPGL